MNIHDSQRWWASLCEWRERCKGERFIEHLQIPQDPLEGYRVVINSGHEVQIFCRQYSFIVRYEAWWARPQRRDMYHVYTVCPTDAPAGLMALLEREYHTPALLPRACSRLAQKKAAIDCYVQWLLSLFQTKISLTQ